MIGLSFVQASIHNKQMYGESLKEKNQSFDVYLFVMSSTYTY